MIFYERFVALFAQCVRPRNRSTLMRQAAPMRCTQSFSVSEIPRELVLVFCKLVLRCRSPTTKFVAWVAHVYVCNDDCVLLLAALSSAWRSPGAPKELLPICRRCPMEGAGASCLHWTAGSLFKTCGAPIPRPLQLETKPNQQTKPTRRIHKQSHQSRTQNRNQQSRSNKHKHKAEPPMQNH